MCNGRTRRYTHFCRTFYVIAFMNCVTIKENVSVHWAWTSNYVITLRHNIRTVKLRAYSKKEHFFSINIKLLTSFTYHRVWCNLIGEIKLQYFGNNYILKKNYILYTQYSKTFLIAIPESLKFYMNNCSKNTALPRPTI